MILMPNDENKPIIYGWNYEKSQSLFKVLSLIEGLRRGNNVPEVYVHKAIDVWKGINNSFKDNQFVISKKKLGKNKDFYDGGHHRIIAYHLLDYDFNLKIIEPKKFDIPFTDMSEICNEHILSIEQHIIRGYINLLKRDKNYIDIFEIKEYKNIIRDVEHNFGNKIDIKSFKEIIRNYINP